ncbi:hypothetical protein [Hymenobacter sp. B81]|uniref:hypothetical protein n=1 Tax=Hymenobacter sp. B81 TaxID=3344878 RepID=UPI0037DCEB0B
MKFPRFAYLLPVAALVLATATACEDEPTATPQPAPEALLVAHTWRLDETRLDGQVTGSGATVKDRYTWQFIRGGAYHQMLTADNTMTHGSWQLADKDVTLQLIDHKGELLGYTIKQLDASTLKVSWLRGAEVYENTYSAQ